MNYGGYYNEDNNHDAYVKSNEDPQISDNALILDL